MKKSILFIAFLLPFFTSSFSQVVIKWQKTIGGNSNESLRELQQTSDGGFVFGGHSYSSVSGDKTENCIGIIDYWIVKVDASGNIEWQNTIGGTDWDALYAMEQTADGGYIAAGESFSDASGDKGQDLIGGSDFWIIKFDVTGNIEWQQTIGGSYTERPYSIGQTTDGGYIVAGDSYSNISGNKTENCWGETDYWILKLDQSGNIQWQNTIGGAGWDRECKAEQTTDGGYIVAGFSDSNVSGDKTEYSLGGTDIWIVKLDMNGNINWQNTIGGNDDDNCSAVHQTADGGYIVGGSSISGISGDKTEDNIGFGYDYWIIKLDASGNIEWQNTIGGDNEDNLISVRQLTGGGYIAAGSSESNNSFDKTQNSKGYIDYWIVRLDSAGNILWDNTIGGTDIEYITDVRQIGDGEYIAGGWSYSSLSGDKTENSKGGTDYWVMELTETFNVMRGKMFYDLNSNSIQDAGEPPLANHIVSEVNTGRFSFSQLDGSFSVSVLDTGNFVLSPQAVNYYAADPLSYIINFDSTNEVDSLNDFAFKPAGAFNDLAVTLTPLNDFNPGFDALYSIDYGNVGTTSLPGTVVFYPDPNLTYVTATTAPDLVTPDSIVWNTGVLSPFQTGSILLTMEVNSNVTIGDVISSGTVFNPVSGDADSTNNYAAWDVIVTGSFDPNEILVNIHTIEMSQLADPPFLEYIINFQNTGTDTAVNVKVSDRMPFNLDMSSFDFVASSAPVEITFDQALNKFLFQFYNIQLPDSNVNEAGSHGFVRFKIKPLSTLSAGDSIVNNASIFFDFNTPVKTNDAVTLIELATMGADETEISPPGFQLFPNPTSQLVTISISAPLSPGSCLLVYDLYGKEVYRWESLNENKKTMDVSNFAAGVYMVCLQANGKFYTRKMIKE